MGTIIRLLYPVLVPVIKKLLLKWLKIWKEFWKALQEQSEVQELFIVVTDWSSKYLIRRMLSTDLMIFCKYLHEEKISDNRKLLNLIK